MKRPLHGPRQGVRVAQTRTIKAEMETRGFIGGQDLLSNVGAGFAGYREPEERVKNYLSGP